MPLRKKIRSGHIIAFVLLMISYFFIFQSTWTVQKEYDWVTNSYKAENQIGEIKNSIIEAETETRGYYITRDQSFLRQLRENEESISVIYNELKALEEENPGKTYCLEKISAIFI